MKGKLIIARHQESEWNKLGIWTGIRDRHLTERGFEESKDIGLLIKDMKIDYAFASMQVRSIETLSCMLNACEQYEVPTEHSAALNERDYGDYTGKNKIEMEALLGKEEFDKLRRGWDYSVPNGESLKTVYGRIVPFFLDKILPKVQEGKNVLVAAHGNSLRALTKYIENISDGDIENLEIPFEIITIYDIDKDGHAIDKEIRKIDRIQNLNNTGVKTQIIATIGPSSFKHETLKAMLENNLGAIRFNFSWGDLASRVDTISIVRKLEEELGRHIPIIADLPGPRIQEANGHTYTHNTLAITSEDEKFIEFAALHDVDYIAVSFVGSVEDVLYCRKIIKKYSGKQKVISKIERKMALQNLEQIIENSDAVMVARGDLGSEIAIEEIPFAQDNIIKISKNLNKPVIVATQMLFSMVDNDIPSRAEVTDVTNAVLEGADAVMLSEETTIGKYPIEAVAHMNKIIIEASKHQGGTNVINPI